MKAPTLENITASDINLYIFILILVNVSLRLWVTWENSISVSLKLERTPGSHGELPLPSPADCPSLPTLSGFLLLLATTRLIWARQHIWAAVFDHW